MFGSLMKGIRAVGGAVGAVSRVPVLGSALRAIPVVGTALSVGSIASDLMGSRGSNLPALPGMPAMPGTANAPAIVGKRGVFRNDANVPDAIKPWTISKGDLRVQFRSPVKGYVIRHDQNGDPYAVPKQIARQYLGWRPSKKPPISVGDWQAVQRADRVTKKVRKIMTTMTRVDKNIAHGKVKIHGKKGGHK